MKIINHTAWRTDQLHALIQRVADDELSMQQKKILRVTLAYKRRLGAGRMGQACLGTPHHQLLTMTLFLPKPGREFDRPSYALIIAHEMAHCRGWRHARMKGNRYDWAEGWQGRYAYALNYPIELAAPAIKAKPGDEQKHQHALTMVAQWTTKTKKATTLLKKWTRKVRYYERKMAAKGQP
jgi:hypothetical protein